MHTQKRIWANVVTKAVGRFRFGGMGPKTYPSIFEAGWTFRRDAPYLPYDFKCEGGAHAETSTSSIVRARQFRTAGREATGIGLAGIRKEQGLVDC